MAASFEVDVLDVDFDAVRRAAAFSLRTNQGVCSFADADDVAQETAIAVMNGYVSVQWKSRNIARNLRSKEKLAKKREMGAAVRRSESASDVDPLSQLIALENDSMVWSVVEKLPTFHCWVIMARYRDGMTISECVDASGWCRGKVTRAIAEALVMLRDELADFVAE
jgi:hypothetical protein